MRWLIYLKSSSFLSFPLAVLGISSILCVVGIPFILYFFYSWSEGSCCTSENGWFVEGEHAQ